MSKGIVLLQDNGMRHVAKKTLDLMKHTRTAPISTSMSLHLLFLRKSFKGQGFTFDKEVQNTVENFIRKQPMNFYTETHAHPFYALGSVHQYQWQFCLGVV